MEEEVSIIDDSYLDMKEVFVIAKYDDEKMIRIQYGDYSDNYKCKTTYIDYNGNIMWDKQPAAQIKVLLNNSELWLNIKPAIDNNIVMLPAEEILIALGYKIVWDLKTATMTATDNKLR